MATLERVKEETPKAFDLRATYSNKAEAEVDPAAFEGKEPLTDSEVAKYHKCKPTQILSIPLRQLVVDHRWNGRVYRDEKGQEDLNNNIEVNGQQKPGVVTIKEFEGKKYLFLTQGFGRAIGVQLAAAKSGNTSGAVYLAVYNPQNDALAFVQNIEENLRRTKLSPLDYAMSAMRLKTTYGFPQTNIGLILSLSQTAVSQYLMINRLSDELKKLLHKGVIGFVQAKSIVSKYVENKQGSNEPSAESLERNRDFMARLEAALMAENKEVDGKIVGATNKDGEVLKKPAKTIIAEFLREGETEGEGGGTANGKSGTVMKWVEQESTLILTRRSKLPGMFQDIVLELQKFEAAGSAGEESFVNALAGRINALVSAAGLGDESPEVEEASDGE